MEGQSISTICPSSSEADCTEIKNKFVAARSRLPVMFIATPKDRWSSMWTQERPSVQVSWALCPCPMVATGLGQFPAPSPGASSNGCMGEQGPCYIQDCQVSPSGFLPSPDPAAPSRAGLRVSPRPGGAAHGPAKQPRCEGNSLGCQHKGFQALAKHTGLWSCSLECVSRIQAVVMRGCPGMKSSKEGSARGWCPAVLQCLWGIQLCIATWGEISVTGTNLSRILWFSWDVSKPMMFLCPIGHVSVTAANGSSGRLCVGVAVQIWLVCSSLTKPKVVEVLVGC